MQKSEVRNRKSGTRGPATSVAPQPTIQPYVAQMLKPRLYGKGVKRVRVLQTHTSWVFLTGAHAYKVKKPVNFGFLDYTGLSARKFFCNEEFRLNQILSPDIYIRVLPITMTGGRLALGGRGKVIDYCLEMKELPQEWIMTEQLESGAVTFEHIDQIARSIADFHARAERGREVARHGSIVTVRFNWDENFAQTMDFRGRTLSARQLDEIKRAVETFIAENRGLFQRRKAGGFVRRCHGDLHSRNIFVFPPGESDRSDIRIFDCIEFNPRFSCADVSSEIAFMAMDLDYWGRKDLADFFVERYIVHTGDSGLLKLLNFYKCYRAYVRGKVTGFVLNDPGVGAEGKAAARQTARHYFELSHRYALSLGAEPRLIAMMGLPAVGKTFVARRLSDRIGAFHFLSDSVRKQLLGVPVGEHRFEPFGKGIYQRSIGRKTYRELLRRARMFLSAGQSVVLDATFLTEESREQVRQVAARAVVPATFVFADCPEQTVRSRLRRRSGEYSVSDAKLHVYLEMKSRFTPPRSSRELVRIDTSQPLKRSLAKIERALLRI